MYPAGNDLPPIESNIIYIAQYDEENVTNKRFALHSLSLEGDIGVNYYMNVTAEEIAAGEGAVLHFRWDDNNVSYKLQSSDLEEKNGKNYYKAKCSVAAAEMTMNIQTTLTINGETVETDNYSVKTYADVILNSPAGTFENQDKLTDLVTKMLDYGAKAQVVFDVNTNSPANKGVEYEMQPITADDITSTASDMTGLSACGLEYKGPSLIFLSKSTLRLYFKPNNPSIDPASDYSGNFSYGVNDPWIFYQVENISPVQYDKVQQLTIGDNTYGYAVTDYLRLLLEKNYSEDDNNLAIAAYRYYEAAKNYFPEVGN